MRLTMFEDVDFKELAWGSWYREAFNKNNFSYWFPKITNKNMKFNFPKSEIIQFTKNEQELIMNFYEHKEPKQKVIDMISFKLSFLEMEPNKKMFMKNGTYSNKFNFETCVFNSSDPIETIVDKFLEINYDSFLKSAGGSTELIVRDFIENGKHDHIYNGMELNPEFRLFYSFDSHEILGVFNYWDVDFMLESGYFEYEEDIETLKNNKDRINIEFDSNKDKLIEHFTESLYKKTSLTGEWSIDFMLIGETFYLIDMAIAQNSAYYTKLKGKENE